MATTFWTGVKPLDNPDSIKQLENLYEINFPVGYKRFVERFNAGTPEPNGVKTESGEEFDFKCLLSFNGGETNSIYKPMNSFIRRYRGSLIPFASTSDDKYYCFKGNEVVLFKQENDVVHISDNFGSFVDNLCELNETKVSGN